MFRFSQPEGGFVVMEPVPVSLSQKAKISNSAWPTHAADNLVPNQIPNPIETH